MSWQISDFDRVTILITDGWRSYSLPKFRYYTVIREPYLDIYWVDGELGNPTDRLLSLDYADVSGYGYANPTSATDLNSILETYKFSSWTDIGPGGDILVNAGDLLTHDGASDVILSVGANESFIQVDTSLPKKLKYVPVTTILTAANIGTAINGSAAATPNDTDLVATADTSILKKITWTNVKAFLKTYFDTLFQPLDSDLTTIAGLTPTTDNFIQSKAGAWASRTIAQVKTDLGIPSFITNKSTGDQSTASTALANITNLSLSIAASQTIYFRCVIHYGASATNGSRYAVTIPASATMKVAYNGTQTTAVSFGATSWLTASGTEGTTIGIVANAISIVVLEGWVTTGATSGTIQIQGRSANAANTVTWYTGSMITGQIA